MTKKKVRAYSRGGESLSRLSRYKVNYGETMTLQEIADVAGISRERIRQTEARALRNLRHPSRSMVLVEFINFAARGSVESTSVGARPKRCASLQEIEEFVPKFWRKVI